MYQKFLSFVCPCHYSLIFHALKIKIPSISGMELDGIQTGNN
jgi:hypothetical protein